MVSKVIARMCGWVPASMGVMWHHVPVLKAGMRFGQQTQRWHACEENLKCFAHMAVASLVGCSWCLDFGYFMAGNRGLDVERAREIPRWRVSEVFTPREREVLEYAAALSQTPPTVTDEQVESLSRQLGAAGIVELTTRLNVALGIESEVFASACGLTGLAERQTAGSAG